MLSFNSLLRSAVFFSALLNLNSVLLAAPIKLPIVNGKVVDPVGTAFVKLHVVKKDDSRLFCSGAVIGRFTILTAAHCVTTAKSITVDFEGDKFSLTALRWWRHPSYRLTTNSQGDLVLNDLGIVRLQSEIPSSIPIIKVAKDKVRIGEVLQTYGSGRSSAGDAFSLGTLRVATTKVGTIRTGQFTVYANSKWGNSLACFGDSGSPVVRNIKKGKIKSIEIVGVNAASDLECQILNDVAPTTNPADIKFIRKYLK